MNSYFFLAAFGPSVRKYLWWKKYITQLILAQFVVGITLMIPLLWKGCLVSTALAYWLLANILFNLILFAKFYIESYKKRNQVRIETKINESSMIEEKNK
nr:PREDICTED: elongation of very long chain fatty acids protein 4-like [Bemisia tabaci]